MIMNELVSLPLFPDLMNKLDYSKVYAMRLDSNLLRKFSYSREGFKKDPVIQQLVTFTACVSGLLWIVCY